MGSVKLKQDQSKKLFNIFCLFRCSKLVEILKSRKRRTKNGIALLDGTPIIRAAADAGVPLVSIYCSRRQDVENLALKSFPDVSFYCMRKAGMRVWSQVGAEGTVVGIKL